MIPVPVLVLVGVAAVVFYEVFVRPWPGEATERLRSEAARPTETGRSEPVAGRSAASPVRTGSAVETVALGATQAPAAPPQSAFKPGVGGSVPPAAVSRGLTAATDARNSWAGGAG